MGRTMVASGHHTMFLLIEIFCQLDTSSGRSVRRQTKCESQKRQPVEKLPCHDHSKTKERAMALNTNSQLTTVPECPTTQGETGVADCAEKGQRSKRQVPTPGLASIKLTGLIFTPEWPCPSSLVPGKETLIQAIIHPCWPSDKNSN